MALALTLAQGAAAQPSIPLDVRWTPDRPLPGTLIRVSARVLDTTRSATLEGRVAGQPLHFSDQAGEHIAFAGIPSDAPDSVTLFLVVHGDRGAADSVSLGIPVHVEPEPTTSGERLRVAQRFSKPPDSALAARIAHESAMAMEVARQAHDTPRLWEETFARPRDSRITSRFGSGRVFNGAVRSRHSGVDFAGATGAPVRAANRGVVALVAEFHLAGNAVYIDHGEGLVTGYFHLSHTDVAEGDTVSRGQIIGRVGATGRVTGPHLHWMARYGTVTVDPLSVISATDISELGEMRSQSPASGGRNRSSR